MEDWASPWAEEDQYQYPVNETKKEIKGTLVTTHPTKLGTLTLGEGTNSPWNNKEDEDEVVFGEWSVPAEVKVAEEGGFQLDGGWHRNTGDQGEFEDHVKGLAPVWTTNTTLSDPPKLAPNPMPKHPMRQHSPDPWATEFSRNDIPHTDKEESSAKGSVEFEKVVHEDHTVTLFEKSPTSGLQKSTQEPIPQVDAPAAESLQSTESKRNSTTEVDRSSSQPSSSPSVTSQHEDGHHESPRTSMEDDTNRPHTSRKGSAKVQELAEHFDGLVKPDEQLGVASGGSSQVGRREQSSPEGTNDPADYTNFEEEEALDAEEVLKESISIPDSPNGLKHISSPVTEPLTSRAPVTLKEVMSPDQASHKFYGPIDVDIDLSILNELFPLKKPEQAEDVFIPDTIPHDSFCSTEERKMWYRISRYGPMLKHNSGDDENYVPVSWPKSIVRDDTLKIVARWMEEDRLSGHVVLGGGGKTSTLFGWGDSKAPSVSLASALASKDIKKPQKPFTSQATTFDIINPTSSLHPSRQIPEKASSITEEANPIPLMPVVNFGWNSVPENLPNGTMQLPTSPGLVAKIPSLPTSSIIPFTRSLTSPLRPVALPKTILSMESPQQTPVPVSASLPEVSTGLLVPVAKITDDEEEVDDEWGDMVSTPNTATFEIIPFSKDISREESTTQTIHDGVPQISRDQVLNTKQSPIRASLNSSPLVTAAIPFSAVAAQQTTSNPLASTTGDPWTSADFSFFDSSAAPLPTSTPTPTPTPVPTLTPTPPPTVPKPAPQNSVTFTPLPPRTPQPPKRPQSQIPPPRIPTSKSNFTTSEEAKQEELVQSIIKGLPDLSYMLRR